MSKDKQQEIEKAALDLALAQEQTQKTAAQKGNAPRISSEGRINSLLVEQKNQDSLARLLNGPDTCTAFCYINETLFIASNDDTPKSAQQRMSLLTKYAKNPCESTYQALVKNVNIEITSRIKDIRTKLVSIQKADDNKPQYNTELIEAIRKYDSKQETESIKNLIKACIPLLSKNHDVPENRANIGLIEDLIMPMIDLNIVTNAMESGSLGKEIIEAIKKPSKVNFLIKDQGKHAELELLDQLEALANEGVLQKGKEYYFAINKLSCCPCDLSLTLASRLKAFEEKGITIKYSGSHGGAYKKWLSSKAIANDGSLSDELIGHLNELTRVQASIMDHDTHKAMAKLRENYPYKDFFIPGAPILGGLEKLDVENYGEQRQTLENELQSYLTAKRGLEVVEQETNAHKKRLNELPEEIKINNELLTKVKKNIATTGNEGLIKDIKDIEAQLSSKRRLLDGVQKNILMSQKDKSQNKKLKDLVTQANIYKSEIAKLNNNLEEKNKKLQVSSNKNFENEEKNLNEKKQKLTQEQVKLRKSIKEAEEKILSFKKDINVAEKEIDKFNAKLKQYELIRKLGKFSDTEGSLIAGMLPKPVSKPIPPSGLQPKESKNQSKDEIIDPDMPSLKPKEVAKLDKMDSTWYTASDIAKIFRAKVGQDQAKIIDDDISNTESLKSLLQNNITKKPNVNLAIPLNVHAANGGFGATSHWVGLFVQTDDKGEVSAIKYVDPLGKPINEDIKNIIENETKFKKIQDLTLGKAIQFNSIIKEEGKGIEVEYLSDNSNMNDCGPFVTKMLINSAINPNFGRGLKSLSESESIKQGQFLRDQHKKLIKNMKAASSGEDKAVSKKPNSGESIQTDEKAKIEQRNKGDSREPSLYTGRGNLSNIKEILQNSRSQKSKDGKEESYLTLYYNTLKNPPKSSKGQGK